MRHRSIALFIASTCVFGLAACSGSDNTDLVVVPAGDSSQDVANSTSTGTVSGPTPVPESTSGPVPGTDIEPGPQDSPSPESGPGPTTGPVPSDGPDPTAGQGPPGITEGPPGSTPPTDVGPPPGSNSGPEGGGPVTTDLAAELQNAASGDQIMDSWVCNTSNGNVDYGFVQGQVRYIDTQGVTDNGTYSITSANAVSIALNSGARHALTDIAFVPIDNDSINRYFTAQHSGLGAVTCVLT